MKKALFLVFILTVFSLCKQSQDQVEKIYEDGVEVVINHLEPYRIKGEPSIFHLEEELVLDLEREDLSKLGIGRFEEFDVDVEANIYFSYRSQIFKFDREGNFVFTFDQIGQGPGEYQRASGLRITGAGELSLYDSGNAKFLLFNLDGTLKREIKKTSGLFTFVAVYLDNGNYLWRERKEDTPEQFQRRFHFSLLDSEFKKIKDLRPSFFIELPDRSKKFNLMEYKIGCEIIKDKIFISSNKNEELEIEVYNDRGELLRKIRKTGKLKLTDEEKDKHLKRWKNAPAWEILDLEKKHYFSDYLPSFKMILVDEEERVLVDSFERGETPGEYLVYIFNREGVFVGTKSLKEAVSRKIKNNRLYCVYRKESGYDKLAVYKLRWE